MSHGQANMQKERCGQEKELCEFHVVGVGASAGGLEALEAFFRAMPTDSGAAFVVVQHLSPDFKSHMEHLLARQTEIAVFRVEDQMEVKPNSIYLIPPKKEMIISAGKLLLTDKDTSSLAHPIDQFFRSLATDCGNRAIGVVLSGTGSDGSRGIRAIHEAGGLVIAQTEDSAKFDGMPLNAQQTGVVDIVLPPGSMAGAISRYIQGSLTPDQIAAHELPQEQLEGVQRVFQLLRAEYGLDFAHYKPSTVARRVNRRVELTGYDDLAAYIGRLQDDRAELNDLYRDLLIGVTRFFRDAEAFERLETEVIPSIIQSTDEGDPMRVWVAGCATGEEAYSIAMLFHEQLAAVGRTTDGFKMFATDVHRTSIQTAASGIYDPEALAEVSDERQARYFREKRDGCHVVPELRKMIVFAPHNVINDAPFTQIDLVSCRNLLIYLQPSAQKKALSLFHFALKTGAVMMLGPSETPGEIADEFNVLDKRWKVYRKRRDVRLPPEMRLPFGAAPGLLRETTQRTVRSPNVDNQLLATYDRLLEQHMPPSFLVDEDFELLHTFGGAERFLARRGGRTTTKLIELIHPDLKTSLSGALQHSLKDGSAVRYTGVRVKIGEVGQQVHLIVQPLTDPRTKVANLLVKLEAADPVVAPREDVDEELSVDDLTQEHIRSLEVELRFTRENLQATIEELETANEELQATNEELVASNEELQSTNEELHSVNEELYTVNTEHQKKIEELTESNNDMDNLLETTRVGVIFLDRELRIRRFTPEIAKVLDLLPHDVGRQIDSFMLHLKPGGLLESIRGVVNAEEEFEIEVFDRAGHAYLLRAFPYKTRMGVEGVVLNLIDIASLKESERSSDLRGRLLDLSHDAVLLWKFDDEEVIYCNNGAELLYGYSQDEFLGRVLHDVLQTVHPVPWSQIESKIETDGTWSGELIHTTKTNERLVVSTRHQMVSAPGGGRLVLETNRDVTQQRQIQEELEAARQEAESASAAKSAFLANVSHELRTPLTAILGFSDILTARLVDGEHRDAAQTIRRNGGYLLELVNDLLDLSKVEADRLDFRKQKCDLPELLRDIYELMDVRAAQTGIPLRLRYESMIPRSFRTDRTRLRQILVNLLSNAIKFTDDGYVELVVDCSLAERNPDEPPQLRFRVVDTGIGMSRVTQAKLFQPFAQADDQVAQQYGGTGLGLSISKRLSERLGGRLCVESTLGKGSTFTLSLPLPQDMDEDELVDAETLTENRPDNSQNDASPRLDLHALIADDRRDVWRVAKYFLEQAGATVEIAQNGQETLDLVDQRNTEGTAFDIVLMDMQMPVMTGYEATRELRKRGFPGPIIALTAGAMKGDREKCLQAGCTDYFAKPIDGPKLVRLIAACADDSDRIRSRQAFRVLVVEDSPDVARLMSKLLSCFGHDVRTATSGEEALRVAERFSADVYLLDINLPDIDGYDLLSQLKSRSHAPAARFFAVTGDDCTEPADGAASDGFDGYFVKPVNPDQLHDAITAS